MTAEAPSSATAPRPQCPRCGTVVPLVGPGTQVVRCGGCGAALQVSVRNLEPQPPEASSPPVAEEPGARPRRRPMVEVPGPRRIVPAPVPTFTVELSQSDIDTAALEQEASSGPSPAPVPAPPPVPAVSTHIDTPWYAEDIERLPEAHPSLGQLALETFEPVPPLPVRPDLPQGARATGSAPHPPGVPASHLPGK
jgi:hypothetical protein